MRLLLAVLLCVMCLAEFGCQPAPAKPVGPVTGPDGAPAGPKQQSNGPPPLPGGGKVGADTSSATP